MEDITCEDRVEKLGLSSLEPRKLRGELIEVYKIMKGVDRVDSQKLCRRVEESITRGHSAISSCLLNAFNILVSTISCGNEFCRLTTLWPKKCLLINVINGLP